MLELFLKYKIAKIVPMQESFFYASSLPKNIKLSQELVALNYEKLSPFSNPLIITYLQEKELYIWFTKTKQYDELFIIPEAFLFFSLLKKENDGIYIFETVPKKILILKDHKLVASFTTVESNETELRILKNEYQINDSFIYSQEKTQQKLLLAKKQFPLSELRQFLRISLDKAAFKNFVIEKLTYPIISILMIYMLVSYSQSYFMEKKVESLTQEYQALKSKNIKIKKAIRNYNNNVERYEIFVQEELHFQDPYKILYEMYNIIKKKDKAHIKSIEITNNNIRLLIETKEDAIKYLNRLNKVQYFKSVIIQGSHKKKSGIKTIIFFIEMKDL